MSTTPEEQLQTLPVNHPQAGYTSPAKDTLVATGTVPDDEQQAWDDRTEAQQAEEEAVAQHEHEVATTEPTPLGEKEEFVKKDVYVRERGSGKEEDAAAKTASKASSPSKSSSD